MGILPNIPIPNEEAWMKWAKTAIVKPIGETIGKIFDPFRHHLSNLRFAQTAALINAPRARLFKQIQASMPADGLLFCRAIKNIRDSKVAGLCQMLNDYVDRLESIEIAVSSLLGDGLPIIEAIFADLHTVLRAPSQGGPSKDNFPASVLALLNAVGDSFEDVLGKLQVIVSPGTKPANRIDLAPGHFYDWVCCATERDKKLTTDQQRKQQQRLRQSMMKVMLTYIDNVEISPSHFKAEAKPGTDAESRGGFPQSSLSTGTILSGVNGALRGYAGLIAAACEHVFISSRPLGSQNPADPADLYHELPLTLKMQRPDLFQLAFKKPGYSPFSADLEVDSEFLAMKIATTSANLTAGSVRSAITCVGNGIWEISPNNPPLVDTIASLIAIPVYEAEKAIVYDLLRRFRVYITDQALDTSNQFVVVRQTFNVPDFSGQAKTEKTLTAAVAVLCQDAMLLQAAREMFKSLPVSLDDVHALDTSTEAAKLIYGIIKDSLAAACVISS